MQMFMKLLLLFPAVCFWGLAGFVVYAQVTPRQMEQIDQRVRTNEATLSRLDERTQAAERAHERAILDVQSRLDDLEKIMLGLVVVNGGLGDCCGRG